MVYYCANETTPLCPSRPAPRRPPALLQFTIARQPSNKKNPPANLTNYDQFQPFAARTVDRGLWTVDRGLWTVDCGLWTVDAALALPAVCPYVNRMDCVLRSESL